MKTRRKKKKNRNKLNDIMRIPYRRCGGCGNWVKMPRDIKGKTCRKCGAPLSWARKGE